VSQNIATTSATNTNTQTFTLNIGVIDHCPLNLGQKIEAQTTAIGQISDTQSKQLATQLQSQLSAALQQSTDMVNGLAATTGGNSQDTTTNISTTIEQSIKNRINSTNINQVAASSVNTQTMTLNIAACQYSPIQANQGIISNVIAQNILTQISNDIANSTAIAAASADVSQKSGMKNAGLDDLVTAIGSALTGPFVIASIVICILIVIGVFAYMAMGGKGEAGGNNAISE
jgi:hypothetical protein